MFRAAFHSTFQPTKRYEAMSSPVPIHQSTLYSAFAIRSRANPMAKIAAPQPQYVHFFRIVCLFLAAIMTRGKPFCKKSLPRASIKSLL